MNRDFFETEEYLRFEKKFGKIFLSAVDGRICYENLETDAAYFFPRDFEYDDIRKLCKKSITENKDYVLICVKDDPIHYTFVDGEVH